MQTKLCTKCGKQRAMKFFVRDKTKKHGWYSSCKDCYRNRVGSVKRIELLKFTRDGSKIHWCNRCKKYKGEYYFYKNPSSRTGIHGQCKNCSLELSKTPNAKAGAKHRRDRQRYLILSRYGGSPPKCACCEEKTLQFLAIDHINGGGTKHRKSIKTSNLYYWLSKQGFPSGFQVLCHNCNLAKGFYGKCPHKNAQYTTKTP